MDNRTINEVYAEIGAELIANEPSLEDIRMSGATIVYLSSDHKKMHSGNIVCGQCEKVATKYKWSIPADYTITIFEPNIEDFNDDQIRILILHELMHIKIENAGTPEERYAIRPHDYEEFYEIAARYGIDWNK